MTDKLTTEQLGELEQNAEAHSGRYDYVGVRPKDMLALLAEVRQMRWQPTHRHYKGGLYQVLHANARDGPTMELVTVYRSEGGAVWVRTNADFLGTLHDGRKRFTPLPAPPQEDEK